MQRLVFIALLLIAGCSDRSIAPVIPDARYTGAAFEEIYVATTRSVNDFGRYGGGRDENIHYLAASVAIPPNHEPGKIRTRASKVNLERDFSFANRSDFQDRSTFVRNLRTELRDVPQSENSAIIYVHGYNNSFSDGVFRIAQLMYDLEIKGAAVHYSWPSGAHPLGYTYDRDSVLFARDGLEELLRDVRAAGPREILLVGHSMGNLLIMEVLRQIEIAEPGWAARNLNGVIMISPDIDLDVFKEQARRIRNLPEPFAVFISEKDRALALSARLNGSAYRLGNVTDPEEVAEFPITLVDVTNFSGAGLSHFTVGTSPALIKLLNRVGDLDDSFQSDRAGRSGLLPGTLLTVQKATEIILDPVRTLTQ